MKSSEKKWKINFSSIQKESHYCIAISQKPSTSLKNPIFSRITFCKYPLETIIAEETVGEEILYGCFNPKNTLELIICGKGYLRLWNVFINEGSLKENQQRFLRGKQEKEKTFIKAQFFSRKLFLLIVATKENMFFIFEGYQLIHELNVYYSFENIYDLNIQNLRKTEDDDDISKFQENFNSVKKDNLEETIENILELLSNKNNEREGNSKDSDSNSESGGKSEDKEKEKKIQKLYRPKGEEEENEKLVKDNSIKYFELINDNLLFVIYEKDGCCLLYKLDWNKRNADIESEEEFKKWKISDTRIFRLAKNIKAILGFSMYKPKNDLILIVDSYEKNNKERSNISLYKLKRNLIKEKNVLTNMINFEYEILKGYFEDYHLNFIDIQEKKQNN